MSCLLKYRWVKLPRALVPSGKGVLGYWARMAARAAFRFGNGRYCGYLNSVTPGMWAGGIVGVKSILGVRRRGEAFKILDELQSLGYITYTLDPATKKLEYRIRDWVLECSGEGCSDGAVYATDGYGFICLPRNITQRLADRKTKFGDADANTRLLLENYRNSAWALECFPDSVADELEQPFESLDTLLDRVDAEVGMGNRKLEGRMESVRKSRLLLDRINEALSVLKRKPGNGEKLYELIYLTYIAPDKLTHTDLLFRLDLSSRHYYRLREQAIRIISLRLWSAPNSEADAWLEVLTLLEGMA